MRQMYDAYDLTALRPMCLINPIISARAGTGELMWRSFSHPAFQPASVSWKQPFVTVPLLYLAIGGGYIVASSYFFGAQLGYTAEIFRTELLKGLIFVLTTSVVLALLMLRAHLRMRASSAYFHDLVQSLPDAVLVVSLPDWRIVFANSACADIFGYRSDELIGRGAKTLHRDQHDYEQFHERSAGALDRGQAYVGDFRMRRRDGSEFPSSHVVTCLTNVGSQEYVVSVVRDETSSFEQRRQVEESAERLRLISENLQDVFWIENARSRRMEFVSPAYEKIWDRPVSEVLEDPSRILESVHPSDRQRVSEAISRAQDGYDIQYRLIRPDGETRWIHGRAFPVPGDDGGTEWIVGIAADITQLVEKQEELRLAQKLQAVGELTGGVAHDFNNLLMVMMGNAEDVAGRLQAGGIAEPGLDEIVAACHRARDLTQSLLTFSRRQPSSSGRLDVNEAVTRTLHVLDRVLGRRIIVLTALAHYECIVEANTTEFETCLMNLIINARDAMPEGGEIQVSTRIENVEQADSEIAPGKYVVLIVADTGQGMSDTVRQRALEPFFTTKSRGAGTGLGLSLVNSFTKSAGGTVRIDSQLGKGATLELYLPFRAGDKSDDGGSSAMRTSSKAGSGSGIDV